MKDTRPWTSDELRTIRTCATTHTAAQVGAMLGRNRNTVMAQARRMGIRYQRPSSMHPWVRHDAETVQAALDAHVAGESMQSIASRLGVPYHTVYGWCSMRRRWRDAVITER